MINKYKEGFVIKEIPVAEREEVISWYADYLQKNWHQSPFRGYPTAEGLTWIHDLSSVYEKLFKEGQAYLIQFAQQKIAFFKLIRKENCFYLGLVMVHPDYQGRGIGKRIVLYAINYTSNNLLPCLELDTDPLNRRAVCLYKKCGFRWQPDTRIHMVNYIPLLLQKYPLVKIFQNDVWYDHYQRQLTLMPDEPIAGKYYEYVFNSIEEEPLRFRVDIKTNLVEEQIK